MATSDGLSRRDFLKALGLLGAVAAAGPALKLDRYPGFRPDRMYGNWVYVTDCPTEECVRIVKETFDPEIERTIPPEYRDRISWHAHWPGGTIDPLDQTATIGWKYTPEVA